MNGSPVYDSGQVHRAWCKVTWHSALNPHNPTHGSVHFCLMHARLVGHSLFTWHSGLQLGGDPIKVGEQEQEGMLSADTAHCEFNPHGEG